MTRLVLVDDPARLTQAPRGHGLVALSPAVELAAERAGASWTRLEEYVDWREVEADGAETYARLLEACDVLDRSLEAPVSTRWHFRALKIVVDGFRLRALAGTELVARTQPREALLLVRRGSLALEALGTVLAQRGVSVRVETAAVEAVETEPHRSRLRGVLPRRRAKRRDAPLVGLVDSLYGIPPVADELRARGADVRFVVPRPAVARRVEPIDFAGCEELRSLFVLDGVDLFAAAEPRLRALLAEDLRRSTAMFAAARAELERLRPDVLLGSVYAAPGAKAAAAAARELGIPVAVSRHGELGLRDVALAPHQDLDAVDVTLCWGAFEEAFVRRHRPRALDTLVVGAPSIDVDEANAPARAEIRARLEIAERESVVLYVANDVSGDEWVTGYRQPFDSDYVRHQRAILAGLVETRMLPVLRPHPSPDDGALEAWAREAIPRLRVVREHPFPALIHLADAVVLDFPSTSLVQALRGSARIYVIDHPLCRWEPDVREHLAAHDIALVTAAELGAKLRADADLGLIRPTSYPPEAREPFSASGEGTAAQRAAEAILRLAAQGS